MYILNLKTSPEPEIISKAVKVLQSAGLLIYPTETVYGLGADAANQAAVNRLLKFKGRRESKPILIAVSDQKMAEKYVELNASARKLYRNFLPGPVAVVSRLATQGLTFAKQRLDLRVTAPEGTVGIRIPDYPIVLKIIRRFGKPITSTSANISGAGNPWSIQDILDTTPKQKLKSIDLALDAGRLPRRPPSTVVDTSREQTEIVRQGNINIAMGRNLGHPLLNEKYISQSETDTQHIAQGILRRLFSYSEFSIQNSVLIFALQGPLGAGKTIFAAGIARGLGITDPIRSPSYTLIREYSIPLSLSPYPLALLYHLDAWRLSHASEFADLGLEKMLRPGNIIIIEWIDRLIPILAKLQKQAKLILVKIEVISGSRRNIKITINN
jgi:L-threonylcarbamoyladenylate synthase